MSATRTSYLIVIVTAVGVIGARADVEKRFHVPENAPAGFLVGYVSDRAYNSQAQTSFAVHYPNDNPQPPAVTVDEHTGAVRTQRPLDREQRSEYKLLAVPTVAALGPPVRVTVIVDDTNDNAPHFAQRQVNIELSELARVGAAIPLPTAVDMDAAPHNVRAYWLANTSTPVPFRVSSKKLNGMFYVDLVVTDELDREQRDSYLLELVADDGGDHTGTLLLNVTIIDANDNAPVFDQPRYTAIVQRANTSTVGTPVTRVHAIDRDIGENGRVTYALLPNTAHFVIDAQTGVISVAGGEPLKDSVYEVIAVAHDNGQPPLQSTAFVKVCSFGVPQSSTVYL
jgi:hypothetical protein